MFQNFDDMQKVAKANMETVMKSFEVSGKNAQTIVTEVADYSRRSLENGTKALEKLLAGR